MKAIELKIRLESPALIGSGEGWGSIVDNDVVFDRFGIPYIPARRVKGILRESALEIVEMFISSKKSDFVKEDVNDLFGYPGLDKVSMVINNFKLSGYDNLKNWLEYLEKKYPTLMSKDVVREGFTVIRQQTRVNENGVAEQNSLRTIRVLRKGLEFIGNVQIPNNEKKEKLFAYAVSNARRIGTNRNRGLGKVKIYSEATKKYLDELEKEVLI